MVTDVSEDLVLSWGVLSYPVWNLRGSFMHEQEPHWQCLSSEQLRETSFVFQPNFLRRLGDFNGNLSNRHNRLQVLCTLYFSVTLAKLQRDSKNMKMIHSQELSLQELCESCIKLFFFILLLFLRRLSAKMLREGEQNCLLLLLLCSQISQTSGGKGTELEWGSHSLCLCLSVSVSVSLSVFVQPPCANACMSISANV